ncbi:MAG: PorP/SprF family type IX secretion system membrane protein [Saprospiraceae bacterium]|nr:PorP/SprF family type IX secretion system membrane protein [Saprospiraceae bacterium]
MNFRSFYFLLMLIFAGGLLSAQDGFRYTFFDRTPLTLNPALAGGFEGTVRVGALLREQDFGLQPGQYQTPVIFADAPLIKGFRKYDWIGFGISFQYDKQSIVSNNLTETTINGGLSYHFSFDKNRKNILSLGVQSGTSKASFSGTRYRTGRSISDYIESGGDLTEELQDYLPIDVDKKSNNTGYTIGLVYTSNISDKNKLYTGLSVGNVGKNLNYSLMKNGTGYTRRSLKFVTFAKYRTELENGLILEPRVVFSYMDPSYEGSFQALAGLKLKKPANTTVYGGLGYNFVNGLQLLIAADVKEFKAFYSFDLNLSDKTSVSGPAGAFEIGLAYIFKIYRKPSPDPVLVCPQL